MSQWLVRRFTHAPGQVLLRRGPTFGRSASRRGESGLTTLEWLLIVAAVAGLAALAVVLVQNVVDDTAEQISGNNARITAAQVAAKAISDDTSDSDSDRRSACRRLDITYSDAFQQEPKRAAFFSNPDGDKNGKCFIVDAKAKKALEDVSKLPAATNTMKCNEEIKKAAYFGAVPTLAQLGGGTVVHGDDAEPECHLI